MNDRSIAAILVTASDGEVVPVSVWDSTLTMHGGNPPRYSIQWGDRGAFIPLATYELALAMVYEMNVIDALEALRDAHPELKFHDAPNLGYVSVTDQDGRRGKLLRWILRGDCYGPDGDYEVPDVSHVLDYATWDLLGPGAKP